MENSDIGKRINKFIKDRITKFTKENLEKDKVGILLHLIPISSFDKQDVIDVNLPTDYKLTPLGTEFNFTRTNIDLKTELNTEGIKIFAPRLDRRPILQIFRNSSIEASYQTKISCTNNPKNLKLKDIRERLNTSVNKYFEFMRNYDKGRIDVYLIILNTSELCMCLDEDCAKFSNPISNSELNLGKIEIGSEIKEFNSDLLAQLYKILYNSFGKIFNPDLKY